jgi:hypothetical protein
METIGQPLAVYPKSLKLKQSIPGASKSLGQQGLRKIRSLEQPSTIFPTTRSTASPSKHRRVSQVATRQLGQRIVAIDETGGAKAPTEKHGL